MPIDVKMPQLGESVTEGTIGRWLKQVGDPVAEYEALLEVTTDKVDTEVPATISGTVLEILVAEGQTVRVGTLIARLAADGEASGAGAASSAAAASGGASSASHSESSSSANGAVTQSIAASSTASAPISPVVARLAAEHGVNLAEVPGTGGGGRVSKKDIERFVAQRAAAPAAPPAAAPVTAAPSSATAPLERDVPLKPTDVVDPPAQPALPAAAAAAPAAPPTLGPDDELVPLSPMRRAIAQHMVHSKRTAPHVTTVMEADLSRIVTHRAKHKADYERQGVKLTFTAYFVEAAVRALREVGIVNSSYSDGGIVQHHRINVGVAVAIPDGLIVPVIKDADDKSLLGLARAVNDLADRARNRRLQPDDTQAGTFTITNHGVSGSIFAMPIINQPQAAILGVGALQKRAVVVSEGGLDAIAIRPMCYLSLTFDHRLIDGATGDGFLAVIKRTLETYS